MFRRLILSGYNIDKENFLWRRREMKSSDFQAVSTPPSGSEPDYVLNLLKQFNLPVTRENYLGLAYPEGAPADLEETSLPQAIRQA